MTLCPMELALIGRYSFLEEVFMTTRLNTGSADELLSKVAQQVAEASKTLGMHITQHDDINTAAAAAAQELAESTIQQAQAALDQSLQHSLAASARQLDASKADLLSQFTAVADAIRVEAAGNRARLQEQHAALLQTMQDAIALAQQQLAAERDRLWEDYRKASENLTREASDNLTRLQQQHRRAAESQRQEAADHLSDLQEQHRRATEAHRQRLTQEHESALDTLLTTGRNERAEQRSEFEQLRSRTVSELNSGLAAALEAGVNANHAAMAEATASLNAEQQRNTDTAIDGINTTWTKFSRILIGATVVSTAVAVAALVVALL